MAKAFALVAPALVWASTALAEPAGPPPESVTVTADKSRQAIDHFVKSMVSPTRMTGKIARWETPICPYAVGVQSEAAKFVVERLKEIAAQVGAPVSTDASCKFNIEIVFTRTPQALLDNIKKDQPELLGYYESSRQRDRLATVTRPIQAWYTTATRDMRGRTEIDSPGITKNGQGLTLILPCEMLGVAVFTGGGPRASLTEMGPLCTSHIPSATKLNVTGSRTGDGVRSMFDDIIIVADPGQLAKLELGTVSDYIAMLALTQLSSLDSCQSLPSIANLLVPDCAQTIKTISGSDLGYLRGLYRVDAGLTLEAQKDEAARQMDRALNGQ